MFRNSVPNLTTIKHELPIPIYLQLYFQGEETESSAMFFADNGSELRGNILRQPKCPCGHWPKKKEARGNLNQNAFEGICEGLVRQKPELPL